MKELQGRASMELDVPAKKCFELLAAVMVARVPDGAADPDRLELIWRVRGGRSTELEFEFDGAASFVPGFIPVGGAGDAIAQAAIAAARDALAS